MVVAQWSPMTGVQIVSVRKYSFGAAHTMQVVVVVVVSKSAYLLDGYGKRFVVCF